MENVQSVYQNITSSSLSIFVVTCIILYICVRFIIYLMQYSLTTGLTSGVELIPGKLSSTNNYVISQTNGEPNIIGISNNEKHGVEFSYTAWLKIDSNSISESTYDISNCFETTPCNKDVIHVFNKGKKYNKTDGTDSNDHSIPNNIIKPNNAPGVYLANSNNEVVILIYMDVIGTSPSSESKPIIIDNIPIMKWFSLIITAKSNVLYIYINGQLKTFKLFKNNDGTNSVFKQNYDELIFSDNNISWGTISDLTYYSRALNGLEIQSTVLLGPNNKEFNINNSTFDEAPSYLNNSWYN